MNRSVAVTSGLALASAVIACSSAPQPESNVSSSAEALTICNCPLETGDASCTCAPPAGECGRREHEGCRHGEHWNRKSCACEPRPECRAATDCTGPLPALCEVCPEGGSGCAHFACVDGACDIVFCG